MSPDDGILAFWSLAFFLDGVCAISALYAPLLLLHDEECKTLARWVSDYTRTAGCNNIDIIRLDWNGLVVFVGNFSACLSRRKFPI